MRKIKVCKQCGGKGSYKIAVSSPIMAPYGLDNTTNVPCTCAIRGRSGKEYTSPFTSDGNKKDDFIKYEKEIEVVVSAIVGAADKYDVDVATTHLKGIAREIEHEIYAKAYEDAAHRFRMREDEIIGVVIKRIEEYITKEEMPVPKYNNNLIITEGTERSKHLIEWHNGALLKVKKFLKTL